ncbi:MAG: hypothetical protein O4805_07065 [Trichodesmium sp. St16_bin2-tuft]|nr:hypothetical protein [Trichodesmium sp. St16_bin2-tuft]
MQKLVILFLGSAFEIDKPHRHNQNLVGTLHVGTLHVTSLLWSTKMKTSVRASLL